MNRHICVSKTTQAAALGVAMYISLLLVLQNGQMRNIQYRNILDYLMNGQQMDLVIRGKSSHNHFN